MLWVLRDQRLARHAVLVAFVGSAGLAALATAAAIMRDSTSGTAMLFVIVTMATATAFPWGVLAQAAFVAMCGSFLAVNYYAIDGAVMLALAEPTTGPVVAAALVSLFTARSVERYRWQIEERELGLRLREERFRALIENGGDLIVVTRADGSIRYVTRSLQRLLGHAPEAWQRQALSGFVHPDDVARLHEALASPDTATVEVRVRDAASAWHVLDADVTNLLGHPAVQGIVFNARDVTSRRQVESELRRSQAALSAVLDSTSDAVWSIDRQHKLITSNAALRDAYRDLFQRDMRPEDTDAQRAPSDELARWRDLYDRVLAGERIAVERSFDYHGHVRHFLISMSPIREGDQITGVTAFSRDITELRTAVETARRNQTELTHVLRLGTMGEIASGLAHEINQPLGSISNYASACARQLGAGTLKSDDLRRGLELIAGEAVRAGAIIRRLRQLGRKGEGTVEEIDLNAVVRRASELIEPEMRLQGISLCIDTAEPLPAVCADGIQIEQVLLNLILNGIEAVQGSRSKVLRVSTASADDHVEVAVLDSGVGLDPNVVEHVFEPFFTTKPKGLGMGLAISRRIIEAHGGRLRASANADGGGSTFSFSLPLA
jgi:PAS domain S-box-containing protein